MRMVKVSIIVPVFGETPHLGELRSSIAAQTFRDFEVIECAPPAGNENAGAARNAGLEQAKGEWIYFADADDRLKPELLERAMAAEGVTAAHSAGLAIRASQAERKRVPSRRTEYRGRLDREFIVVSPSRWEGMPYLMMKARALGCRVLATDCPGNRDVLAGYERWERLEL